MFPIQMRSFSGGNEKLAAVSVFAGVGHRKQPRTCMNFFEVFVFELLAVDRLAPRTVAVGKVAALAHEVGDNAVER